jgi:hypothetical protein
MARKKVENQEVLTEVATETVVPAEKVVQKPKKRNVDRDEYVDVMSNTTGKLFYSSRTGAEFVFTEYGQTDQIQVSELINMNNKNPRYLKEPWLIIMDEDVVQFLGLSKVYENIIMPEEFETFFNRPVEEIEAFIRKAPKGMTQLIVSMAQTKVQDGTLDSMRVVKLINDIFGTDLTIE